MRVLICGIDGYLGWPLAWELLYHGHEVMGVDCYSRRSMVSALGCSSLTKLVPSYVRANRIKEEKGFLCWSSMDIGTEYNSLKNLISSYKPDTIVHLAEMPSAPWSMISRENCIETHSQNLIGTLNLLYVMKEVVPDAHLLKLGTMGEYGTPNLDIPEGFFELEYNGRKDIVQFPRQPGSWYHLTKVHDTNNIIFACRNWGLRSTDVMQGVVFGVRTHALPSDFPTRFDYDECFGTAINRFAAQAICEEPLTIYGAGGQTRGWLPIQDSMTCMRLAIENPPMEGEYRVFNQFAHVHSILELADIVKEQCGTLGINVSTQHYENPRKEAEVHYYNPICEKLKGIGYSPSLSLDQYIKELIIDLLPYTWNVNKNRIVPIIKWRN